MTDENETKEDRVWRQWVPAIAHPLFSSLLPGLVGVGLGVCGAYSSAITGAQFARLFDGFEATPEQVEIVVKLSWAIPWCLLLAGVVAGGIPMALYTRYLRRHRQASILRITQLLSEKEAALLILKIDWPLLIVLALWLAASLGWASSMLDSLWSITFTGGLFIPFLGSYTIRKEIYEEAAKRLSPAGSQSARLGLSARLVGVIVIVVLLGVCGAMLWVSLHVSGLVTEIIKLAPDSA